MATRGKHGIQKPIHKYGFLAKASPNAYVDIEPTTYRQALTTWHWRHAMTEEFDNQITEETWDLVPPDGVQNIVGCRWVFRIKRNSDGSVERFKARLVAKGYNQRPGIDYFETFSPVIKRASLLLVLSLATTLDWPLRQVDVNHAFLQGPLEEEVYMEQPPVFVDADRPHYICRLKKAIYGLKQAPRAWYNALRSFLLTAGFKNSLADTSLFILSVDKVILFVLVYVDDIVVTGNSPDKVQSFIDLLGARFKLKDLGALSYFLGIEVVRDSTGLTLTQSKYITDLLGRVNMLEAKPVLTPMADKPTLTRVMGTVLDDPTEYRMVLGSLQYLIFTRPDIAFAVNKLSQFMHQPTTEHWEAAKRILRYLCGTRHLGLHFSSLNSLSLHAYSDANSLSLHAYSDADWAGNKDDFSSTGAHLVYLGKHLISWSSKKQPTVARSSTEAEYKSVADTASEVQWILSLLLELKVKLSSPPVIYCDNVGATYLCANPVFHSRMKHVAVDYHHIRNLVQTGVLRVSHVSSADQLADCLTKPLPRSHFLPLVSKIGLTSLRPS